MLIKEKYGNLLSFDIGNRIIDKVKVEWYEANKRILHKQTTAGRSISLKFLQQNPDLKDGDILYADETTVIAVEIIPCEAIVLKPASIAEASAACYEIGNKHLPLYFEENELLVPFDASLYRLLQAAGYKVKIENRKLNDPIKTSVSPHAHSGSTSLFNKILKLTTSS